MLLLVTDIIAKQLQQPLNLTARIIFSISNAWHNDYSNHLESL